MEEAQTRPRQRKIFTWSDASEKVRISKLWRQFQLEVVPRTGRWWRIACLVSLSSLTGLRPESILARERLIHLGTAKETPLMTQLTFSLNFIER